MSRTSNYVSINGIEIHHQEDAKISIWDRSFHRGDGVFEVMRILNNGRIRSLENHLDRLNTSADMVGCPLPSNETLKVWLEQAAVTCRKKINGVQQQEQYNRGWSLRLIATKGGVDNGAIDKAKETIESSVIISSSPLPLWPDSFALFPLMAPWHPAGFIGWETPVKWTSYGPNVVSTRKAQASGFTDAILLTSNRLAQTESSSYDLATGKPLLNTCHVLDGPNFAIGWITGRVCYFPCSKTLGLLPSITQRIVAELAASSDLNLDVELGVFPLQAVLEAQEVFVMSTTRGVIPVTRIGETEWKVSRLPLVTKLAKFVNDFQG